MTDVVSTTHYESYKSALQDVDLHDTITAISAIEENGFYPIDKLDAHIRDIPHVAISLFIFKDEKLLIQRRASTKYHSAGLWANTVCSHPRWNESVDQCATRRLKEELGFSCAVEKFGEISYRAQVGELFENEQVHCYVGYLGNEVTDEELRQMFNPVEVCDIDLVSLPDIQQRIEEKPETFTEWFKIYLSSYNQMVEAVRAPIVIVKTG